MLFTRERFLLLRCRSSLLFLRGLFKNLFHTWHLFLIFGIEEIAQTEVRPSPSLSLLFHQHHHHHLFPLPYSQPCHEQTSFMSCFCSDKSAMISFSSVRSCFGERSDVLHLSIIRLTPCSRRRTVWAQLFSNWSHLVAYERSPPHSSIFASIHFLFSPLRLSILFFSLSERRLTVFPPTSSILRRRLLLFPFNINTFHIGVRSYVITSIVHLQQQLQRVTRLTWSTIPSFDIFLSEHNRERERGRDTRIDG